MLRTKVVEKIRTPMLRSKIVFRKSCRLWDNVEQYGRDRQTTHENIRKSWKDPISMPDNTGKEYRQTDTQTHTHTLRICNIYWLSTATTVPRKHLNSTLHVHCSYCCIFRFDVVCTGPYCPYTLYKGTLFLNSAFSSTLTWSLHPRSLCFPRHIYSTLSNLTLPM
jgi:hypothetical protein